MDCGAVLGIELGPVTEVFMHQRSRIIDMFGAEDMAQLVDQSNDVEFRFGAETLVAKNFADWNDDIVGQALRAIADPVNARPAGGQIATCILRGEGHDEIITPVFRSGGKFLLQHREDHRSGIDALGCRPSGDALGQYTNVEFPLVIIRCRFDKTARFFSPVRIARAKRDIREHFDPDHPLRRVGAEKRTGAEEERAKD